MLPDWTRRARPLPSVTVEIGFLVEPDFYFGPENRFTSEQWESLREPLYAPAAALYSPPPDRGCAQYLLSRSLADSADELVRYYSDVLRLVGKHGKSLIGHRDYFALQPIIYSRQGEFELRYFVGQHWETAALTLQRLEQTSDGMIDDEYEQGWRLEVVGKRNRLYFRVTDPDNGDEETDGVSCDRHSLVEQIRPVRERTARIRTILTETFPEDYWSLRWLHRAWGIQDRGWMDEVDAFGSGGSGGG